MTQQPWQDAPDDPVVQRCCTSTGLALESSPRTLWRIQKSSYGALNPLTRDVSTDRMTWGRYDALGHKTIYAGRPAEAAYAESTAPLRRKLTEAGPQLQTLFDDLSAGDTRTLIEAVEQEWAERQHQAPAKLPAGWRHERLLYRLDLAKTGWFIDVEAASSLAAIAAALGPQLAELGVQQLTVSHLRGENRYITTVIADWLWAQVLDDGSLPRGVRFGSKHGSDWLCWAIWLRALEDSRLQEDVVADPGTEIPDAEHNPPLASVADMFQLHVC